MMMKLMYGEMITLLCDMCKFERMETGAAGIDQCPYQKRAEYILCLCLDM